MPDDTIPEHRHTHTPRSGDAHEIRHGKLHNVDQEARDAATAPKRKAAAKKSPRKSRARSKGQAPAPAAAPTPAPTPTPAPGE